MCGKLQIQTIPIPNHTAVIAQTRQHVTAKGDHEPYGIDQNSSDATCWSLVVLVLGPWRVRQCVVYLYLVSFCFVQTA